ncbi:hypothetical protein MNBD_GAMMA12-87 [hydrothermal vent metagenome]|uniref:Uncharacterized protein n=1 Tax=hydrothermal vent metagenome TaxID=652676 RepID=A0A3B0Y460_9ZZZZ
MDELQQELGKLKKLYDSQLISEQIYLEQQRELLSNTSEKISSNISDNLPLEKPIKKSTGLKSIHDILNKPNLTNNTFFGFTENELAELVLSYSMGHPKTFKLLNRINQAIAKRANKSKFSISHTVTCDYENTVIALALALHESSTNFLALNDTELGCTFNTTLPPMGIMGLQILNGQESRLNFTVEPIDSNHSKITAESSIVSYRFMKSDFGLGREILDSLFEKISTRINTAAQNTTDSLDEKNYFNFEYIVSPHKALKVYSKLYYCFVCFAITISFLVFSIIEENPDVLLISILSAVAGWYLLSDIKKIKAEIEGNNKPSKQ